MSTTKTIFREGYRCLGCERKMHQWEGVVIFNFWKGHARLRENQFFRYCFDCFLCAAGPSYMPYIKGSGAHQTCHTCGNKFDLGQHIGISKYGHYSLAFHLSCWQKIAGESFVPPLEEDFREEERGFRDVERKL